MIDDNSLCSALQGVVKVAFWFFLNSYNSPLTDDIANFQFSSVDTKVKNKNEKIKILSNIFFMNYNKMI